MYTIYLPRAYPIPVSTSVKDNTVATFLGNNVINIEIKDVHATTSAKPVKILKKTPKNIAPKNNPKKLPRKKPKHRPNIVQTVTQIVFLKVS